ncbi:MULTISPECIES: filamentous haemagglutinin family protein [unclassified Variovorax]|uniref:filamentous haemagglutinin family protein n=1 Tax=unclassified Variovorax TaxID=663243 RepID=UPI002574C408|nr:MULTISPECIES: filamentous haemagglutinin family protein [unclassified Variovorax]MDM0087380.1 filamentous hemagglutinin family protein [Variovorax sp. J22G40]MDM0144363.1 filamentous hemagglutinin family protein [Variovorax sp. J2P1-31]
MSRREPQAPTTPRTPRAPHRSQRRLAPIARAIAVVLATGGVLADAHAQRALGAAWLAQKNVIQGTAQATGRLPNGQPVSSLTNPTQQRDNAQMQRSLDNLNLAARGIAAQQAAQEAARLAALNSTATVPDGLVDGGLKVDTNSLTAGWLNAKAPVQNTAGGRTVVGIEQTDEKAILNWESFNVGRNTTVKFDQKGGAKADGTNGWIALNRINDPSGKPSQIAGQIQADGAVYIVNRNGIVFNGSAQVNTRSLVASSLALSDKQFKLGINKSQYFDDAYQGQADAFAIPQFGLFTAERPDINLGFVKGVDGAPDTLGGVARFDPGAAPGAVQVQAGAQLAVEAGGKIMLFAPKVHNAGTVSAPDGQVILAAGENVHINTSKLGDKNGVRGLEVAVSAVPGWAFAWTHMENALSSNPVQWNREFVQGLRDAVLPGMAARTAAIGYDVSNSGIVQSERGNITLQAQDIHQNGVLTASTALNNRNGSILLRAWGQGTHAYQNSDNHDILINWLAGTLTLGEGSVTRVMPDASDTSLIETTALATRYQPGRIALYGQLIDLRPRAGVLAPSGTIEIESAVNPLYTQLPGYRPGSFGDGSRVYLDAGAYVSVAGIQGAAVDMSRNFVEAELRINELRDSPLLLDSWVRGKKVMVDRRASGVFTDGPMAGVEWVKNSAGVMVPGAWAGTPIGDVTGWVGVGMTDMKELSTDAGRITVRAGGEFISRTGSLFDVSGGSVRYSDGLNTATKLMGADGRVYAMDKAFSDRDYTGIAGRYTQVHQRWGVSEAFVSPLIGRNAIEAGYTEGRNAGSVVLFAGKGFVLEGDYAGGVVVGERQQKQPSKNGGGRLEFGGGSVEDRPWSLGDLVVSHDPHRLSADFRSTSVLGADFIAAPRPGRNEEPGKLSYILDDTLSRSRMGSITFHMRRDFTLAEGAVLDMAPGASLMINEFENSTNTVAIDGTLRAPGGNISALAATGTLRIGAQGRFDTGGQWINTWLDGVQPARWAMDGGSILLSAKDFEVDSRAVLDVSGGGRVDTGARGLPTLRVGQAGLITLDGVDGRTDLGALDMRALAAGSAGRLAISTGAVVQIGGERDDPARLWLPETLYTERGFGVVSIAGRADIGVADGAVLSLVPFSLDTGGFDHRLLASGARLADAAPAVRLPAAQRFARKPSELSLSNTSSRITIGAGASVGVDTGGRIQLKAEGGAVTVQGTLSAPAGAITVEAGQVTLEADAQLLARGAALIAPDAKGRLSGRVLDGGRIELVGGMADLASVALQAGSLVDVSGSSGQVDSPAAGRFGGEAAGTPLLRLDSDGGSIRVQGALALDGRLVGHAGGASASGGALTLTDSGVKPAGGITVPTRLYYRDKAGVIRNGLYTTLDLDIFDEYGTAPLRLTAAMRTALTNLSPVQASGMLIDDGGSGGGGVTVQKPWEANPVLDARVVQLLNTHFFSNATATQRIQIGDVQVSASSHVSQKSLADGGFADLSLNGKVSLNNVQLQAGRSIAIGGTLSGLNGSSASLSAPHLMLGGIGGGATPAANTAQSGGQLTLKGQLIDIQGSNAPGAGMRIGGFARTVIEGQDLRFIGEFPAQFSGALNTDITLGVDGDLVVRAGQVYPSTGMTGILRAGDSITVERFGEAGPAPLSAGGTLRLEAPVIAQNGVLRAPFGQIELLATQHLTLGAGSLSSVSGAGLNVPYGSLINNEHWQDPRKAPNTVTPSEGALVAPPEKRITLKAPDVGLAAGAVLDISGGGDLFAAEFVPGPGGSHDVLNVPGMYAVLPGYGSAAPVAGAPASRRVWLAGSPGLAAGWYTLLPARYALLPGAFAVQDNGRAWLGTAARASTQPDGSHVVQGRAGDALGPVSDAPATGWRVMSGATLRQYTEYNEAASNAFFSSEAFKLTQYRLTGRDIVTPRLARDGGAVVFDATASLVLDGSLKSAPDTGGRGGLVDIAGQKIAIVGRGLDAADLRADGYLVIDAASLSNFGAGSLLVGGKRSGNPQGLGLEVTATDIVVRNGAGSALRGPEIILAASEQVGIDSGSVLRAVGTVSPGGGKLVVKPRVAAVYTDPDGNLDDNNDGVIDAKDTKDDVLTSPARDHGALVRLSNGDATTVLREGVDTTTGGRVRIGEGAVLQGGASLLIDATRTTELAGSARLSAERLSVAAGRISFGGGSEGMLLDTATLAQLSNAKALTLRSYSSFDFYRSLDLGAAGLAALTFDGATFASRAPGDVRIQGDTVTLANSGGAAAVDPAQAGGAFVLDTRTLVLGGGDKAFAGFGRIELAAREQVVGEGKGSLSGASALTLRTPLLTGRGGAVQSIATTGDLQVLASASSGTAAAAPQDSLGSRLSLSGRNVLFASQALALGGSIELGATGGSVVVADGARLDVGGFAKNFFDVADFADAGRISLSALGGDVRLAAGSRLNLAAHRDGGSAGTLSLAASGGGTVVLDGAIAAQAGAGGKAGGFALDIAALPDFAGFSQRLNDAGFNRSRQFRIRQGDVALGGLTTVEDFVLTADQGRVDISGSIDARAAYGGAVRITGGNGVAMQAGAQLRAGATGELGSGRVTLDAAGGSLDLQGGLIDVAGADGGKVRLRARQSADHRDLQVTALRTAIQGARSAVLEGVRGYDVADYDGRSVDAVKADAVADAVRFAALAPALAARLGRGDIAIAAGIEIASAGDLVMNGDWNLFRDFAASREGSLTLRAGGNLLLNGHLSDGFDQAGRDGVLQDAASWDLRLVAGADLASADRLALRPLAGLAAGTGSVVVGTANTSSDPAVDNGAGKLLRTGTGDLTVRAGRDFTLAHKDSVAYTAGRKDTMTWADFTTARADATYGVAGGHLDLAAQGDIGAQASGQRYTEWLNRQGMLNQDGYFGEYSIRSGTRPDGSYGPIVEGPAQSSWWVNYGEFRQGVGALGGGNVKVSAGGDLRDLGVMLTTHLRLRGGLRPGAAMAQEMRNGGLMTVDAGGAIRGGQYYVARGAAELRANETATGHGIQVRRSSGSTTQDVVGDFALAPVLSLGDATLSLRTAGHLLLQAVIDPLLVRYGDGYNASGNQNDYQAYMSGYTGRSALRLSSTGGDLTLVNQAEFAFRDVALQGATTTQDGLVGKGANRFPAITQATAMNGSLEIQGPMFVMPGTTNDVRLLAQKDVFFNNRNYSLIRALAGNTRYNATYNNEPYAEIIMSYATPEMMPSAFAPLGNFRQVNLDALLRNVQGPSVDIGAFPGGRYSELKNPEVLPLAGDREPSRVYASQGSVLGLDMMASEQTWTRAGTDIRGLRMSGRNNHADDVTLLEAGNDILAMTPLRPRGGSGVVMQGAGTLLLTAGRDVYADDVQIRSVGNQLFDGANRPLPDTRVKGLPDQGAAITVMAGMNHAAGYEAFASAYLDPAQVAAMPEHLKARAADGRMLPIYLTDQVERRANGQEKTVRRGLVSYMKDMTGETLDPLAAWSRFQTLQPLAREQFLRQVYLLELREAGRDQNEPGTGGLPRNGGYNRGYAAIATLFPGDQWKGDVAANKLMLRTMAGGDIDVLTPGGGLQVAALGATVPDGYGLVTLASGHINVFAREDVTVNRSRILSFVPAATQQGSDQIIWSTVGDIDAGRGSKTVRVPSGPDIGTDVDGNTTVRERSDMSGSGIGTVGDGDVDLVAPLGTVNAGDAGLRVAGNLNIAALQVLNADNIQVKGEIKGLPVIAAVNIGALTNASAAASQAAAAAQEVLQRERAAARQTLPSVFTVRVLGFGGEPAAPGAQGAPTSGPPAPRPANRAAYDRSKMVQIVGLGADMDAAGWQRLTEAERRSVQQDR